MPRSLHLLDECLGIDVFYQLLAPLHKQMTDILNLKVVFASQRALWMFELDGIHIIKSKSYYRALTS